MGERGIDAIVFQSSNHLLLFFDTQSTAAWILTSLRRSRHYIVVVSPKELAEEIRHRWTFFFQTENDNETEKNEKKMKVEKKLFSFNLLFSLLSLHNSLSLSHPASP